MPRITKTIAISTNRLGQRQPDRSKNASPCKLKEGAKCKDCWAIIMAATARMSFLGLGRVKTQGPSLNLFASDGGATKNLRPSRTRFPSANVLSGFLHGQGQKRPSQRRPVANRYLRSRT